MTTSTESGISGYLTPNSFSSYHLTEDDSLEGSILTTLQKQVIHNLLVVRAEQKLNLQLDAANPSSFIQEEACLAGEIAAYRTLIDNSEAAVELKNNPQPSIS